MQQELLQVLKNIYQFDISEIMDEIRRIKDNKQDFGEFLDFIETWYRDILVYKATQDSDLLIFKEEYPSIREISGKSGYGNIGRILDGIMKARMRLQSNVNMELAAELLFMILKENTASIEISGSLEKER